MLFYESKSNFIMKNSDMKIHTITCICVWGVNEIWIWNVSRETF